MKKYWIVGLLFASAAMAETKVLTLEGVHCADCVATLKEKICVDGEYKSCSVKLVSEKNELGELKLVTKGDKKVDMVKIAKVVEDEGYKIKPEKKVKK
jgi:copper chaperone CopZ